MELSTSITPERRDAVRAPRPRDHHIGAGDGSRLALCGAIPPWDPDQFTCSAGAWRGESACTSCGGAICATCLRAAREGC